MKLKFRKLTASEIEARIGTVSKTGSGLSLLLYKDARVDQKLLDEAIGPMNWKNSFRRDEKGRLFCTVSIWDAEKKIFISKEDVGIESYSQSEKGEASDAFKRACFKWGIGVELYATPFIWIPADKCNISPSGNKYTCYDTFSVKDLAYDNNDSICYLEIQNNKTRESIYIGRKPDVSSSTASIEGNWEEVSLEDTIAPTPSYSVNEETIKAEPELSSEDPAEHKILFPCSRQGRTIGEIYRNEGKKFLEGILQYGPNNPKMLEDVPFVKKFLDAVG